ncbi:hypothetical protein B0H14DRAFT_3701205 [Mycena olivaceomarginata]|nr:hypothetical protein B0H14DRAFT_3701205 [Mycena olivaceomarginata]
MRAKQMPVFSSHRFIPASRSPYFHTALVSWPAPAPSKSLTSSVKDLSDVLTLPLPSPPFTPASLHFTLGLLYTGILIFSHRTYDPHHHPRPPPLRHLPLPPHPLRRGPRPHRLRDRPGPDTVLHPGRRHALHLLRACPRATPRSCRAPRGSTTSSITHLGTTTPLTATATARRTSRRTATRTSTPCRCIPTATPAPAGFYQQDARSVESLLSISSLASVTSHRRAGGGGGHHSRKSVSQKSHSQNGEGRTLHPRDGASPRSLNGPRGAPAAAPGGVP